MEAVHFTTITAWKEYAESKLPAPSFVMQRNKKITSVYASLYNENPALLKWAGMASFASHKVGLALKPFELYDDENGCLKTGVDLERTALDVMDDLNIIRTTNNKVYEDIGWVHFAYNSEGGINLLNHLLKDKPECKLLLEGFNYINEAKKILDVNGDKQLAEKYTWYGNGLLLKQEQVNTVQPMFSTLDKTFKRFLALATAMDFDGRNLSLDRKTYTSFYIYMWVWGKRIMLKTRSLPSIVNFEHRWLWIDKRMVKIWQKVDASDAELKEKIRRFIELQKAE